MAYKEIKLEKGEAESLMKIWDSGMNPPKKKTTAKPNKKPAPKKKPAK